MKGGDVEVVMGEGEDALVVEWGGLRFSFANGGVDVQILRFGISRCPDQL